MANTNRRYLSFDFAKDNIKDPIINFSRGSTKTIIDKNTGLLRTLAVNVPAAFDDACGRQELWKAGSKNLLAYSDDLTNPAWSVTNAVTVTKAGYLPGVGQINRITLGEEGYFYQRPITLINGASYQLSFWAKKDTASAVSFQSWAGNVWAPIVPLTDSWAQYTVVMTGDGSPGNASCGFGGATTKGLPFLVTGFQLEVGSSATAYEPNPVVIQPGFLIEGAATNYAKRSTNLSTAPWSTDGSMPAMGTAVGPDGTTTATVLPGGGYVYDSVSLGPIANNTVTFSIWLRSPSGPATLSIRVYNSSATIRVDATWKRYYISGVIQTGGSKVVGLFNLPTSQVIHVWGAQVEVGSFPSSYIPTTGSAVTRAVDSATIDPSKFWNSAEGTFIAEADFGPVGTIYQAIMDMSGNAFEIYRHPSGVVIVSNLGSSSTMTRARASTTAKKLSLNGGQVYTGLKALPATGTIFLGINAYGDESLNGTLQRFEYWPKADDDYMLQQASNLS